MCIVIRYITLFVRLEDFTLLFFLVMELSVGKKQMCKNVRLAV